MKNLSNKMLYVNAANEEIVVPLSRFLTGRVSIDTNVRLYFDSHVEGYHGNAAMAVDVACTDAEDVLKSILGAFSSSRDSILDLLTIHSNITSVNVNQSTVGHEGSVRTMEAGSGFSNGSSVHKSSISRQGNFIKTEIYIDLDDLNSGGTAKDVIGKAGTANCHIGQITDAKNGTIFAGWVECLETPTTGEPNIDLVESTLATITEDTAFDASGTSATLMAAAGDWTQGTSQILTTMPTTARYLYLAAGDATDNTYDTGVFRITLLGE
tara:strand:- start:297 stop:1100 length:804 start_codon:yes stop_codon:yes gene_type:complete